MIRVIYRWRVAPENVNAFREIWRVTTNHIHDSVAGALGSVMLKSYEDESEVLTIARWESFESWKRFWGNADPKEMEAMHKLGKRVSAEVFEEFEDYTR